MERRLLLVFALTFLVIILFQPLLKKYMPQTADAAHPKLRRQPSQSAQPVRHRPAAPQVAAPATGCHQAGCD